MAEVGIRRADISIKAARLCLIGDPLGASCP